MKIKSEKPVEDDISSYSKKTDQILDKLEKKIKHSDQKDEQEKILKYVTKTVELSGRMIDSGKIIEAQEVLKRCQNFVIEQSNQENSLFLFKINNAFAHLENAQENVSGSLKYLEAAIQFSNKFSLSNNDPISLMPAETYLNAANALMFMQAHQESLQYAEMADKSSQIGIMALNQLMQLQSNMSQWSIAELEKMRISQLDIRIMSHLAKANPLERLGMFKQALHELDIGKSLLEDNFGKFHPLMNEFDQLRAQVTEQRNLSKRNQGKTYDDDQDGIDRRSELMKKGRIKRTYFQEQSHIVNEDLRGEFDDLETHQEENNYSHHHDQYPNVEVINHEASVKELNSSQRSIKSLNATRKSQSVVKKSSTLLGLHRQHHKEKFHQDHNGHVYHQKDVHHHSGHHQSHFDPQMSTKSYGQGSFQEIIINQRGHHHHCNGSQNNQFTSQLIQARQLQDEQFRMMELMIETQPAQPRHYHQVPLYPNIPEPESDTSSSSSSDQKPKTPNLSDKSSEKPAKSVSSSSQSISSCSSSEGILEENFEDKIISDEIFGDLIDLDPRPRGFEDKWESDGKKEKIREAGLGCWIFIEHDIPIDPPKVPFDIKRWWHFILLRWRFKRWRYYKSQFAKESHDNKKHTPYIAAWFYKKFENNQRAEIRVYCRTLQHKREEKKMSIENTKQFKKQVEIDAEGGHIYEHLIKEEKIKESNKILKQETNTDTSTKSGYQVYARDVRTFVKDVNNWNPLIQAYNDIRSECLKHRKYRDDKDKGLPAKKLRDKNIIKSNNKGIAITVKPYLVIDYMLHAIHLQCIQNKLAKVKFRKPGFKESLKINLNFIALKYKMNFDKLYSRGLTRSNTYNSLNGQNEDLSDIESDKSNEDFEDITTDKELYEKIQKRMKELRGKKDFDEETQRLKIQYQARCILESGKLNHKKISYIVDKDKRGKNEILPIILNNKEKRKEEKVVDLKKIKRAEKIIKRILRKWIFQFRLERMWTLVHKFKVIRFFTFNIEVYKRSIEDKAFNNCKIKITNKASKDYFIKYETALPCPEKRMHEINEARLLINLDKTDKIVDVKFTNALKPYDEDQFYFVEGFRYPEPNFSGTVEICRNIVAHQIAVRLVLQQNISAPKQYFIESLYVFSDENEKKNDYLKLKELPVIIRYMRYFMMNYVDIHYEESKLGYCSMKGWDDVQFGIFSAKMRYKENKQKSIRENERRAENQKRFLEQFKQKLSNDQNLILGFEAYIRPDRNHIYRSNIDDMNELRLHRFIKQGEQKSAEAVGPFSIKVVKGNKSLDKPQIIIIVFDERHKDPEYLTVNKLDEKFIKDVRLLKELIEDNVGFYYNAHYEKQKIAYLSMYGLKAEPVINEIVEPPKIEPKEDFIQDALIARAQAIWRGSRARRNIAKDKKNLYVRLYQCAEDSRARISVRRVKVKNIKETITTNIEETTNFLQTQTKSAQGQIIQSSNLQQDKQTNVVKQQKKVDTAFDWAYLVEVEDLQTPDPKNPNKYKKFRNKDEIINQVDMPRREIAIEYFRMAVYIWWKEQAEKHLVKLEKTQYERNIVKTSMITVAKTFNQYFVEGFTLKKPENFQIEFIELMRAKMLNNLYVKELQILANHDETQWFVRKPFKNNGIMYVLSQADVQTLSDSFMKIEVFLTGQDLKRKDQEKDLSDEAKYILQKHNEKPLETKYISLYECCKIIRPKSEPQLSISGVQLVLLIEQTCYSKNVKIWDYYLQAQHFDLQKNQLFFKKSEYDKNVYGVGISEAKKKARESAASYKITRCVRRWLVRKRIREELRRPGFKFLSGVLRMLGLQLVYVMTASDEKDNFTITLSERKNIKNPEYVVQRAIIKESIVQEAIKITKEEGGPEFILEAVQVILEHYLLETCQSKISASKKGAGDSGNFLKDWKSKLKTLLFEFICQEKKIEKGYQASQTLKKDLEKKEETQKKDKEREKEKKESKKAKKDKSKSPKKEKEKSKSKDQNSQIVLDKQNITAQKVNEENQKIYKKSSLKMAKSEDQSDKTFGAKKVTIKGKEEVTSLAKNHKNDSGDWSDNQSDNQAYDDNF